MHRWWNGTEQWYLMIPRVAEILRIGYIFTQPDMLDPGRITEEDFQIKPGSAIILLEYRVQQSPKTQMCPSVPVPFTFLGHALIEGNIYVYRKC
jgi:hypothetical protein